MQVVMRLYQLGNVNKAAGKKENAKLNRYVWILMTVSIMQQLIHGRSMNRARCLFRSI